MSNQRLKVTAPFVAYGRAVPNHDMFPDPIIINRPPTTDDQGRLGQIWIDPATTSPYMLASIVSGIKNWVSIAGGGGGTVSSFITDVGGPVVPTAGHITIQGGINITTDGSVPNTIIINGTGGGGGVSWSTINASQPAVAGNGYIVDGAGTIVLTLPAVCPAGSVFKVTGINNATGWQVKANAGQTIYFGAQATSVGGTLTSTGTRNSIEIVCVVADTGYNVLAAQGNITVA